MKNIHIKNLLIIGGVAMFVLVACSDLEDPSQRPEEQKTHQGHAGHKEQRGTEHEAGETSDLDRPVAMLFAATCEHGMRAHECDECRYEVGVVKAPDNLFKGGLLRTVKAESKNIAVPLTLNGEVEFDLRRVAHVGTQVEGIIRKVYVSLGDKVKRGQALMGIDSVVVGEGQAAYLETRGILKLAQRNHERQSALRQEGISSEREFLRAVQELEASQIRADAALGKLTRLGMAASAVRTLTKRSVEGRLVLRAPCDGIVIEMHAVAGEIAKSEESLLTVGDNSSLWVWADLFERDFALVFREQAKRPLAAEVVVKAYPRETFQGKLDFVSPSMSKSTRTVKVRIVVGNPSGRLLAGMFASVKIFLPGGEKTLVVPSCAVLEDQGRSFVFVHHQGDYYVRRPVLPGKTFADWTEINKGLEGGETVVADGAFLMKSDVLRSKMGAGCAD